MEIDNALLKDFDEFLDEEYDLAPFESIMTADSANYYIRRVKKNNEEKKKYQETAKELKNKAKEKIDLWLEKRLETIENDNVRCTELLEEYFKTSGTDPDKKLRLSEGSIGMYKQRDTLEFPKEKEQELLSFLVLAEQDNEEFGKYIQEHCEADIKALRKDGKIIEAEDENGIVKTYLSIGGVTIPDDLAVATIGRHHFGIK